VLQLYVRLLQGRLLHILLLQQRPSQARCATKLTVLFCASPQIVQR
jgi:hypothetical protein